MLGISKILPWACADIDLNGRYNILKVSLEQKSLTIVGIYAGFGEQLKGKLSQGSNGGIIIWGDFNAILDKDFDLSRRTTTPGVPKTFFDLLDDLDLVAIWRKKEPTTQYYTF